MEYSNEIKAKVFAQYWGNKIKIIHSTDESRTWSSVGDTTTLHAEALQGIEDGIIKAQILIKPLSEITDQDAIEVSKLFLLNVDEAGMIEAGKDAANEFLSGGWSAHLVITFYQLLQSCGYDLPNYLLGGKTLHQAGLAIY